jgi:hypothetical protein
MVRSLLKTKSHIKLIFQYWTVYVMMANIGDVSANKARCLLLARANAQDTDSGAVVAERQRIRANFERAEHA